MLIDRLKNSHHNLVNYGEHFKEFDDLGHFIPKMIIGFGLSFILVLLGLSRLRYMNRPTFFLWLLLFVNFLVGIFDTIEYRLFHTFTFQRFYFLYYTVDLCLMFFIYYHYGLKSFKWFVWFGAIVALFYTTLCFFEVRSYKIINIFSLRFLFFYTVIIVFLSLWTFAHILFNFKETSIYKQGAFWFCLAHIFYDPIKLVIAGSTSLMTMSSNQYWLLWDIIFLFSFVPTIFYLIALVKGSVKHHFKISGL